MIKFYVIPAGTKAQRSVEPWSAVDGTIRVEWKDVTTSRHAWYTEKDIIHGLDDPVDKWYVFVLPAEAAPWTRLSVRKKDVDIQ